jgi:rfaE bifunctional protein kinase chain/domain
MIKDFLEKAVQNSLLIVGEAGIDEYIWGDSRRISPEAPVPVIEVESCDLKLGLSANVAQNILSLRGNTYLISVCGNDTDALKLENLLNEKGIVNFNFVIDPTRPTLRKTRVIAQKQHVVRVDYEKVHPLDAKISKNFLEQIDTQMAKHQGLIVQDYGKGLFNADTISFVREAKKRQIPVFVDPNRNTPLEIYRDCTLLTPNLAEAQVLIGKNPEPSKIIGLDDEKLKAISKVILEKTNAEHVIITCGEYGMVSLSKNNTYHRIPTYAREVFDVTGAGDTVIAVLSMAYCQGYSLPDCMKLANIAAGIVVGKMGAASVSPNEFLLNFNESENLNNLAL